MICSYQHGNDAEERSSINNIGKQTHRRIISHKNIIFGAVAMLVALMIVASKSARETGLASLTLKSPSLEIIPILGSKHKHHHDHHHHDDLEKESMYRATPVLQLEGFPPLPVQKDYLHDLEKIDWDEVEADIEALLTDSQDWWPADYGNYGGLFMRLSWHSCGSYRTSDGRGGCDGGGQRFDPERSWPDNTNLDKARRLLQPIKEKHGNGLSWGDLFALSGTVALRAMGGPDVGFCAGRLDFQYAAQTQSLGPTPEQDQFAHCEVNGKCPFPLGQNTLGLIYVNPEGPMGVPDAQGAADTVRDVFGRMDWNGRELVALIGGGHTFGKAHGATTDSPGKPPNECPFAPWNGATGVKAVTSGFEGAWTSHPTQWDNKYFQYLVDYEWEPIMGPGGHHQWRVKGGNGPQAPVADPHSNEKQDIMMLTTDVGLVVDPEYNVYVHEFAANETAFREAFAKAWYKLVTRDVGPVTRCVGPKVPPAQQFQHPLPDPPKPHELPKTHDVSQDLHDLMDYVKKDNITDEIEFVRLAWQCASTYRATDYMGGCNGASIRFPPGSTWPINAGLDDTLKLLEPIKKQYGERLSYADLIVLAGTIAAERMGAPKMKFCPGRTDAVDGSAWDYLAYGNDVNPTKVEQISELCHRRGQTLQECMVVISFPKFQSSEKLKNMLESNNATCLFERGMMYYPELRYWAEHYAVIGTEQYSRDFAIAWEKIMIADRFQGPLGNVCMD